MALGPYRAALYTDDDALAKSYLDAAKGEGEAFWRMPLDTDLRSSLKSPIADLNNAAKSPFAGCITAALFLEHFVEPDIPWVHIDTFAWNQADRPGRPQGGEALGLRALFRYLQDRYGRG